MTEDKTRVVSRVSLSRRIYNLSLLHDVTCAQLDPEFKREKNKNYIAEGFHIIFNCMVFCFVVSWHQFCLPILNKTENVIRLHAIENADFES